MKNGLRIHARVMFDGLSTVFDRVLTVQNGIISAIDKDVARADVVLNGMVAPGYIDLQVNGGGGVLFNTVLTAEGVRTIALAHAQYGTTSLLPTIVTDSIEVMEKAADAIAKAIKDEAIDVLGVHFEGPFISTIKKGVHCEALIRKTLTEREWALYARKDIGKIVVTLAPEVVSPEDIKRLTLLGVKVCIGHSNANYATTMQAIDAGATGATHLFNAMSPLTSREPNVTGAILSDDRVRAGLIVDGEHVSYANCKMAIRAKQPGGIFLVTDAMPPTGAKQTAFSLFGKEVTLTEGKLISATGELAGSYLDMSRAVKNTCAHLGIAPQEAIRMASQYPFEYLNASSGDSKPKALIAVGNPANFIELEADMSIRSTWIKGNNIYLSEDNNG